MVEPCDSCECGLSDEDAPLYEEKIDSEMEFQKGIRDYVLENLNLDDEDEDIFIKKVTICPTEVSIAYQNE